MTDQNESLFSCAHAALTFAFNYSGQQFDKSAMARLASSPSGPGKGLGGLDGAGQAGIVRAELHRCGELIENLLIARVAPKYSICECRSPCCSGMVPNQERSAAINALCTEAMQYVAGGLSHYRLRRGIIERYFGEKIKVSDLASLCGVSEKTVFNHNEKITKWLKGVSRDVPGAEARAWHEFEEVLKLAGLIESAEAIS